MNTMKTLALAVALTASAGAQAVVDLNFQAANLGSENRSLTKVFTNGGVTATVTPGSTGDGDKGATMVWQDVKGLGVTYAETSSGGDFRGELDYDYNDTHKGESLTFSFVPQVWLTGVSISLEDWVDQDFTALVTWGGGTAGNGSQTIAGEGDVNDAFDIFALNVTGSITWLTIAAKGHINDPQDSSNFYVQGLKNLSLTDPNPAPPAVPVPAAAWLMGSALVGLSAVARRRRI